jgi:hypothetical protein
VERSCLACHLRGPFKHPTCKYEQWEIEDEEIKKTQKFLEIKYNIFEKKKRYISEHSLVTEHWKRNGCKAGKFPNH